jgi:hypothetical protein
MAGMRTFTSAQQQNLFLVVPDTWHKGTLDPAADEQAKNDIEQWIKRNTPDEAWDEQEIDGEVQEPFFGINRRPEESPAEGAATHYYEVGVAFLRKVSVQRLRTKSGGAKHWKKMRFFSPPAHRGHKVRDVFDKYFTCGVRFYKPLLRYPELVEVRGRCPPEPSTAMPMLLPGETRLPNGRMPPSFIARSEASFRAIENFYCTWPSLDPQQEMCRQRRKKQLRDEESRKRQRIAE